MRSIVIVPVLITTLDSTASILHPPHFQTILLRSSLTSLLSLSLTLVLQLTQLSSMTSKSSPLSLI